MILFWCCVFVLSSGVKSEGLIELLKWKQIEYEVPDIGDFTFPDALQSVPQVPTLDYVAYNNVPMGVSHYNMRLFITMPRRRPGIPATLNYVDLRITKPGDGPKLKGYPNYAINQLHPGLRPDSRRIISVYRTRVDSCNRLWFVDTGMLEYPGNRTQVQPPSIWIINLNNDAVLHRFEIPREIVEDGSGIPSITVDVDNTACDQAFAYIPDLYSYALYVYSLKDNRMWRFSHNYFHFDPLWGDFTIARQSFQWNDGIFSITLGNKNADGFRQAYFHPMCSTSEFTVSTKVLRNESNAQRSYHGTDFQYLGFRGPSKQSTMHDFDPKTGVIFYAEIAKYGVGCWNTNKPFSDKNHDMVQYDMNKMIYPSDLTVDDNGYVWVMTNSMPLFIYSNLNPNEYNFRVWKRNTAEAVANTACSN